jgi:branched-chain amino acid aminotransferase
MPAHVKIWTADGLHDAPYSASSLADAAQHEPDSGVYTVTNTWQTDHVLKLDAHFDRLEDSAARQQIPLQLDRRAIRAALREMITAADWGNSRFRVTVPKATPERIILTIEPFTPPSRDLIENGVRCITAADSARHQAEAKTTGWMHARKKLQAAMPEAIYETFLLDANGFLLEGLSSNCYFLLDGELRTADIRVLKGISRQIVFEVAPSIMPLRPDAAHISQIPQMSEAFLTSSSRGIIPVVEIDGLTIGDSTRGTYTARLRAAYDAWVTAHLQPL